MGLWKWEGLDKNGKRASGQIEATTEKEVRRLLRGQGNRPKKITPPSILEFDLGQWMVEQGFASAFGTKELSNFTKQLAIMINAGVPILQGLEIIYKTEKNAALKNAIQRIAKDVQEGKTLAESMTKQKGFDKLYCNLVKAGEIGGILDVILNKLSIHLEKQEKTKSQIKSAMTYPFIVTMIGIGVVWGLVTFVVPQFVGMLKDTGKDIPGITQFVMDVSDLCVNYSAYAVPIVIIVLVLISSWIKTPAGKIIYDKFAMKIPGFGVVVIKGNLSSFTRTLGTLLSAGVSLIDALEICIETIDNGVISRDIAAVKKSVIEGKTLTEPLQKIDYFPEMVAQMIKVGEQTGSIDQMLDKIAVVFEDEVNMAVESATKLIEPLILVGLGGTIAVVLVAIYLPMFMSAG
ncbi:type II secretion system F family protein [Bacteriovorax sp. Seq25_V]|uniref:type II secretion system F family protein n=1 Tax=Bacteriovorax sp. Seq25_V TaxID=1201288 RepID=UPI00038A35DD|nr:type II secretion system F family protein [Bacteriovorax sp. Seq25_V]EQC43380.1 putative type IV pilus assembly protein TapC [Bacteriovorax sp. Seq25_V]